MRQKYAAACLHSTTDTLLRPIDLPISRLAARPSFTLLSLSLSLSLSSFIRPRLYRKRNRHGRYRSPRELSFHRSELCGKSGTTSGSRFVGSSGQVASVNYPSSALIGRKPRQRGRDLTTPRSIRVHCAHNREGRNSRRRTRRRWKGDGRRKNRVDPCRRVMHMESTNRPRARRSRWHIG